MVAGLGMIPIAHQAQQTAMAVVRSLFGTGSGSAISPPVLVESRGATQVVTTSVNFSITAKAGDIITIFAFGQNETTGLTNNPSGGGITWVRSEGYRLSGYCEIASWYGVSPSDQTFTVTLTRDTTNQFITWEYLYYVWRNSDGIGNAAKADGTGVAPSISITPQQINSALVATFADANYVDGTVRTWRTVNSYTPVSVARDFVASHRIELATGTTTNITNGAWTFAAVVKRKGSKYQPILARYSAAIDHAGLWINSANQLYASVGGFVAEFGASAVLLEKTWMLVCVTKPAGETTPRAHIYNFNTRGWTHVTSADMLDDNSTLTTGWELGGAFHGDWDYTGSIALAGVWDRELTDNEVEALVPGAYKWLEASPKALWALNQADTATPVVDLTGNGADQTLVVGTEIVNDQPNHWTYATTQDLSGSGERLYINVLNSYTGYSAYWPNVGAAGSKTVGLSAPSGQKSTGVVLEVKGQLQGTELTLNVPAAQVGDLLIAVHANDWGSFDDMNEPTGTPGTWTLIASANPGTNQPHLKVWMREVTVAGNQTVTLTNEGSGVTISGSALLIRGADTSDPLIDASSAYDLDQLSGDITVPGITVDTDDSLLVFVGVTNHDATWTDPAGMTRQGQETNSAVSHFVSTATVASGATGDKTATASVVGKHCAALFAIRPEP